MTSAVGQTWEETALIKTAQKLLAARKLRSGLFPPAMFDETAWEVLLVLYSGSDGEIPSVRSLAQAARAPLSTTERWISFLEQQGLVECERQADDQRSGQVYLTDKARRTLQFYLLQVLRDSQ